MKMKTGMKRSVCRIISFMMVFTLLSAYGCNKGKTIDPDFYPTQNVSEEETIKEEKTVENITKIAPDQVSDEDILKPEKNTFRETGKYEYNPVVIPDWILKMFENNPKIIRVAKQALIAINNCETEFVLDEDIKLTQEEMDYVFGVIYYSTPLYAVAGVYETDKPNVYNISYFQEFVLGEEDENGVAQNVQLVGEASPEEAREIVEAFQEYVTETINNNLSSDMTEREMASILYKKIVTDIALEVENTENYQGLSQESFISGGMIKGIFDKKYTSGGEFVRLYSFFLTQLHIESREVLGTSGFFTEELKSELRDAVPISYYWGWQVLQLDGEYFNCDITLEAIAFKERYQGAEGAEPDMLYFGMSDKKRSESYKVGKSSVYYNDVILYNTGSIGTVPNCPNDLDFH